jgi:protein ImuA
VRRLIEKTCEQYSLEGSCEEVQVDNRIVTVCTELALCPVLAVSSRPPTASFSRPALGVIPSVSVSPVCPPPVCISRVSSSVSGTGVRTALLADLRARIAKIEQHPLRLPPSPSGYGCLPSVSSPAVPPKEEVAKPHASSIPADPRTPKSTELKRRSRERGPLRGGPSPGWLLGIEEIDRFLPAGGLQHGGLHEIKPEQPGDAAAALGFALALAAQHTHRQTGGVVWVQPIRDAGEYGRPYGPGLGSFGLDPASLVVVEPKNLTETLWAIEESLKRDEEGGDQSLALVLACIAASTSTTSTKGAAQSRSSPARALGATAQRRLSLAAARSGTPCLLLTSHASPGLGGAHTRWRAGRQPGLVSALVHAGPENRGFAPRSFPLHGQFPAQGHFQVRIRLERCRGTRTMMGSEGRTFDLEWCDAAYRFRLLAALADRTARDPGLGGVLPQCTIAQAG